MYLLFSRITHGPISSNYSNGLVRFLKHVAFFLFSVANLVILGILSSNNQDENLRGAWLDYELRVFDFDEELEKIISNNLYVKLVVYIHNINN